MVLLLVGGSLSLRRAAMNADIMFMAADRTCSLDVTLRQNDGEPQAFSLQLRELPRPVMAPPKSFYEVSI